MAVDQHVFFIEMPAARPHDQHRDFVIQRIRLAALLQRNLAADCIHQVDLAGDLVVPVGRMTVLEVGHVRIGARVQRVDDHLAFDWAGDLDATPLQVGG